ncbi:exodeoxyribonuclease VII small subunit [Rhodopila sp.]|jgi:exodeoxyribonuclease VII small subunit|uniref:exodeoxyribonuclease VII small subunit n=1 Tax=Rhodopila sp. TaxID=2480087 RepID=UPI0038CF2F9E
METSMVADALAEDISTLSFEDALSELDQIVRGLEGGALKLDVAIQAFERGVKLRRHCEAKLAEVEARVEALVQQPDGSQVTRPLE